MDYAIMSNFASTCELPCTTVPLRKFVSIFGAIPSPDANSLTITLSLPAGTESASLGQAVLYGGTGAKLAVLGGGEALSAKTKPSVSYSYLQKADQELFLYIEYSGCVSVSASYSKPDGASLTVLNLLDTSNASSGSEIEAIWDRFAEVHPSITVDREDQYGMNFDAMLAAMVELKALPDVVYVDKGTWNATLQSKKLLKDLSPLLKKDGLETAYDKEMLDKAAVGYQGVIPSGMVNTHVMYINNRVLKSCGLAPAKTLDELKAQVSVLASKGKKPLLMANAEPWVMQSTLFSDIAARLCGPDWLIKIKTGEKKFTDTDFVASLALVKSLYTDGILGPETLTATYGDVPGPFLNDEYAYYIDGAWRISAIAPAQTEVQQADILLGVFPRISDAAPALTSAAIADSGWGISASVPAGSLREEAAWELIKWLEGKEAQEWRVKSFNTWIPSLESVDVSALPIAPIQKSMAGFRSAYELDAPVIDNVLSGAVVDAINSSLQQICNGTLSPEDAAAAIQNAWTTITP
jgi:raffinose/stachyose/melibiose transport system substrate-binding protein